MKKFLFFFLLVVGISSLNAQGDNTAFFSFNNCDGENEGSFGGSAMLFGEPGCECGVNGDALLLDGNNDRVAIPDTVKNLLTDDFTISFYFTLDNTDGIVNLFSYRSSCNKDSSLAIYYTSANNTLRTEFASDITNIFELRGNLDLSKCWHHVTVTRFNLEYTMFIDGNLAATTQAPREVVFGKNAGIFISNSPCIAFIEDRLQGMVDELAISDFALPIAQIQDEFAYPDRIITPTSTIFLGEVLPILTGVTCASSVSWSPIEGLDNPQVKDPILTGVQTTNYAVAFNNGACISRDTLRVNVVDPSVLQCDDLLLPSAFTPNNDGLNDLYGVSNKFLVETLKSFEVYDRSGSLLFTTSNLNSKWDGSFKGKAVNPGMFLYKIAYTCGGQDYFKVDNFSILR